MASPHQKALLPLFIGVGVCAWEFWIFSSQGAITIYKLFYIIPIPLILFGLLLLFGGLVGIFTGWPFNEDEEE